MAAMASRWKGQRGRKQHSERGWWQAIRRTFSVWGLLCLCFVWYKSSAQPMAVLLLPLTLDTTLRNVRRNIILWPFRTTDTITWAVQKMNETHLCSLIDLYCAIHMIWIVLRSSTASGSTKVLL